MFRLVALLIAISACAAQSTPQSMMNTLSYPNCGSSPNVQAGLPVPSSSCTSVGCTTFNGITGSLFCSPLGSVPAISVAAPYMLIEAFSAAGCPAANVSLYTAITANGQCVAAVGQSYRITCSDTSISYSYWPASATCNGAPAQNSTAPYNASNTCTTTGILGVAGASVRITCGSGGGTCFHEDTVIQYGAEKMTLASLRANPNSPCRVPHVLYANGVAIKHTCGAKPLRLSADHLVYTARGLLAANNVRTGDVMFADHEQTRACHVTTVTTESAHYFGLNCPNSIVLADGIKASTFGTYHTVPALWMRVMSSLVGVDRASRIGDTFASWAHKAGLV